MGVDLEFELRYLLSDVLGKEVSVANVGFDSSKAELCMDVDGRRVCVVVKQCRGLEGSKAVRCISKALTSDERILRELVARIGGEVRG